MVALFFIHLSSNFFHLFRLLLLFSLFSVVLISLLCKELSPHIFISFTYLYVTAAHTHSLVVPETENVDEWNFISFFSIFLLFSLSILACAVSFIFMRSRLSKKCVIYQSFTSFQQPKVFIHFSSLSTHSPPSFPNKNKLISPPPSIPISIIPTHR